MNIARFQWWMRCGLLACGLVSVLKPPCAIGQHPSRDSKQPPPSLEVQIPAGRFTGLPIHWSQRQAVLLESSGRFQAFDISQISSYRVLSETYHPQSLPAARSQLAAELGADFETLISGPYVIAAPQGCVKRWERRFTALLAGYRRYFEVRDWPLSQPDFPLCVIVYPDRDAFVQAARQQVDSLPAQAVGSYFPKSNRCILYPIPGSKGTDWSQTEATIVHEAIHQLAYNTGAHERLFENPLWFVEGLATMFEIPAVYDTSLSRSGLVDRMHPDMLHQLQPILSDMATLEEHIQQLISGDQLFQSDPLNAYALSWAMSFTLAERMPREFGQYLRLLTAHGFAPYTPGQRQADFRTAFETSPQMLSYQIRRLLAP